MSDWDPLAPLPKDVPGTPEWNWENDRIQAALHDQERLTRPIPDPRDPGPFPQGPANPAGRSEYGIVGKLLGNLIGGAFAVVAVTVGFIVIVVIIFIIGHWLFN
jgi:hypothetical protein